MRAPYGPARKLDPADQQRSKKTIALGLALALCSLAPCGWTQNVGVTDKSIRIGATIPLEGDFKAYGLAMKRGMDAALAGQTVQKRQIEFVAINDFYNPDKALEAAKELIGQGIFAMVNSFGSPTTRAVLPVLAENKVPAFGFYTGAAFTGPGDVLNFRASYTSEVESVVDATLAAGVKPEEVCGYAQNDAYGMSGVKGLRGALAKHHGTAPLVAKLDQILDMPGDNPKRNNIGPVGVYQHDTVNVRDGYASLKKWEETSGNRCRLVATTAVYDPATTFIAYARYKGEPWIFSSPSPAAGSRFATMLKGNKITDKVIATQIVPSPDSALPVVAEARKALGQNLDYVSLESYIVGKLFVAIASAIDGPLTHENFLKAARRQPYDIGGVKVDFTTSNQGSNFVLMTHLKEGEFMPVKPGDLESLFRQ